MIVEGALDALINLAVAYIIISVAASAAVELLSQLLRVRGRILANTIRQLLQENTADFYATPTIRGLRQRGAIREWLPVRLIGRRLGSLGSWLASKTSAVGEKVRESDPVAASADHTVDFIDAASFAHAYGLLHRRGNLPSELRGDDGPFLYEGQLQPDQVRAWYEEAMRATKRQYRRTVQLALFILGWWVAATIELDSAAALMTAFHPEATALPDPRIGYVMTAAAVALGAQYWFDAVGKLLGLRKEVVSAGVWGRAARKP